jgi:alpha-beta hydrolase superfamily lysophospholipase
MIERAARVTESRVQGNAGPIYTRTWEIDGARGGVVLVHGYGEHIGRYEHVARALNDASWSVYGLDHVGHGRSEGERVLIPDFTPVVEDLHSVVQRAKAANPGQPVAMIGHSMGGGIAARYVELHPGEVAALVLSGPVIGSLRGITSLLGMDEIPTDPLPVTTLSRDPEVGRMYDEDPLVWHGPFKRQTLLGFADLLLDIALDADKVTGPVLWQHGQDDQLVRVAGSRRAIALLRNADVTEKIYPGARHEIFNETNKDEVLGDTVDFLASATKGDQPAAAAATAPRAARALFNHPEDTYR